MDEFGQIVLVIIFVALSAFFSATETSYLTFNKIRLRTFADTGNKRARLALRLSDNSDNLLSSILIGNNIVNIASASLATVLFVNLLGPTGTTISTLVMTVVMLIFGEVTPKSLAKEKPERFAMFAAPVMRALVWVFTPLNFLFSLLKKGLSRLGAKEDRSITEEELLTIVEEAQHEGAINEDDSRLIHSVIEFNDSRAADILTPRVDVAAVELNATWEKVAAVFSESEFSRLPVYDDTIDHITGVIHLKDFYNSDRESPDFLAKIQSPVLYVTTSTKISNLLKMLQYHKAHIAVVTDEYGGTAGIITMEDILEELVGEIWDEHDDVLEEIEKTGENSYRVLCNADLDKFFEFFEISDEDSSTTVNGWLMRMLGRIPSPGDSFEYNNMTFVIEKTDGLRVTECSVHVQPEETPAEPAE